MDPSFGQLKEVGIKSPYSPYVVYFRINDQEPFSIRDLDLVSYLPLVYDDQRTVAHIQGLISSGVIKNSDEEVKMISRSKDGKTFTPIVVDCVEVDFLTLDEDQQLTDNIVLLEELETLEELEEDRGSIAVSNQSPIYPRPPSVMDTPPPDNLANKQAKSKTKRDEIIIHAQSKSFEIEDKSVVDYPVPGSSRILKKAPVPRASAVLTAAPAAPGSVVSLSAVAANVMPTIASPNPEDVLKDRSVKLKSQVWQSFSKLNKTSARCQICTKIIKHGGNTSNLSQHLNRKHPIRKPSDGIVAIEKKRKCAFEPSTANKMTKVSGNEVDALANAAEPKIARKVQMPARSVSADQKIDRVLREASSSADGGTSSEKITNAILFMLATDNCPLTTVENEGFCALMKATAPRYTVPSRCTITRLMDDKYDHLQGMFKREIACANALTLTCDIWSDISNRGYLGITVHNLDNSKMKSGCLGVFPLTERHTANYISEILVESLQLFKIDSKTVTAIVTDNGLNIKKAAIDCFGPSKHIECFAHVVSHIVPDAIKSTPEIAETIAKVKAIVTFTKRSVLASDQLRRLQIRDGKTDATCNTFLQDVPTRWNSTLYMIERFLDLHEYVYPITLKCKAAVELLTRENLDLLRDTVLLLKPVENVITECSGDKYVTSCLIIPIIRCLTVAIRGRRPITDLGLEFQENLLSQVQRRFENYESNELLAMSTILDPRFKKIHFEKPLLAETAVKSIDTILKRDAKGNTTTALQATQDENDSQSANDNLWSFHDKLMVSENQPSCHNFLDLTLELKQYLNQPVISRAVNPIEYWDKLKTAYPLVHTCALKYLSVVATSVPSERLFSKAGAIKTETRNRLTGNTLNKLIFPVNTVMLQQCNSNVTQCNK